MAGVLCPFCRAYNGPRDKRCGKCDRILPPPALGSLFRTLAETELLGAKVLGSICIAIFVLELMEARHLVIGKDVLSGLMRLVPTSTMVHMGGLAPSITWSEPWRLLSACFVHLNALHLVMNLMGLADLARVGEAQVGTPRFVLAFTVTGILGFVASQFWYGGSIPGTAGASGAVFGLDGMLLGAMAVRRDARWKGLLVRAIVYSLVFGLIMPINQAAHFGGLFAGIALGALFELERRPWRVARLMFAVTGACLVAIVASLAASIASPAYEPFRQAEERARSRMPP